VPGAASDLRPAASDDVTRGRGRRPDVRMRTPEIGTGQPIRRPCARKRLIPLTALLGTRRALPMSLLREDLTVTDLLSSLLTHLVLAFAALVGTFTAEPVGVGAETPEPRPAIRVALPAAGDEAAVVDSAPVGACGEAPTVCSAARMRWQITLPATSMKRCAGSTCAAG
jgi:hypothetical protein